LLTGKTRLVVLIGRPVSESLSPRMQNAAFAARGLDWAYVGLAVDPGDLEQAAAGLLALGFAGANVTTPYKTAVLSYCDELDDAAERAGSVNTLVVHDGRLLGSTTDGAAVRDLEPAGMSALVLGAGGAAQAVATALAEEGAAGVTIAARTAERAHGLAVRLRTVFPQIEVNARDEWPPSAEGFDLVVNATPVRDQVILEDVGGGQTVVDLAYYGDGRPTSLVQAARERGCRTVDGLEVLLAQGAASFERWTGVPAPVEVMRGALAESPY
jgi:shikimate dehydrogenase